LRPGVLVASIFQIVQEQRKYTAKERAVEAMAAAQLAPGLVVEARRRMDRSWRPVWAEPELRLGVIFHPEYWAEHDAPILAILQAFGQAVRRYADSRRRSRQLEGANA